MSYKKNNDSVLVMVEKESVDPTVMEVKDDMCVVWIDRKEVLEKLDTRFCMPKGICDCLIQIN